MSDESLAELAASVGLQRHWVDASGESRTVDADDLRALLETMDWPCANENDMQDSLQRQRIAEASAPPLTTTTSRQPALPQGMRGKIIRIAWEQGGMLELHRDAEGAWPPLPRGSPIGYHRLQHADGEIVLAIAPPRCFGVADLPGAPTRLWGPTAQIYALRGRDDYGFGGFGSLAQCASLAASAGAGALAISPTHAMFLADPEHYGPYSPSSRLFLNVLYVDPHTVFSDEDIAAAHAAIDDIDSGEVAPPLIDWPAASRRKLALLRRLHIMHKARSPKEAPLHYNPDDPLHVHACFEALHAHLSSVAGHVVALPEWPPALSSPRTAATMEFAGTHADALGFHAWLQQLAGLSLARVQATARTGGMPIGLIADLAVGSDPHGSDAWAMGTQMFHGLGLGAPPDAFNPQGQTWGLTTFAPQALREHGYAPWLRMLRATLRNVGGIRIDHAMGLARLWVVPEGRDATHGAYLHMPADDLLNLLALESWRHRAVVIGEDLGTIPPALRKRLRGSGLLGMSVLWFERDDDGFVPPMHWPDDAVAMSSTHDLPTLAGWWRGRDLQWQARVHESDPEDMAVKRRQRRHERKALWQSLHTTKPAPPARQPACFVDAVCAALAGTLGPLLLMPMEDLLADIEQVNLPGITRGHPNWRRRNNDTVEALFSRPDVRHRIDLLARRNA
ncbi:MAG TPA: 4-alpha-glucanotransferase [Rhodanobacteraceae bacterium]|nr:4-alpha-glucanotransferase [Rhodanobacteraceae bacterium]